MADGVVELTITDPVGRRLPPWTPGSHLDLLLPIGICRQYSLCGDRWDGFSYRVAVLREATGRGGSSWIHEHLREGDVVGLGGPRNHFPLVPAQEYLFITGGIGITPLLPMIEQAERTGTCWRLLYVGRSRTTMAYAAELSERFPAQVTLAPRNEVATPSLADWIGPSGAATRIYVCGPARLIAAVSEECSDWPPHSVRSERFVGADVDRSADRAFEVELVRRGQVLTVPADRSILQVLTAAGMSLVSSCQQGTCGTCEVVVVAGDPDHRDSVLSDRDRLASDCVITCVSRARTDRLVLDL